MTKSLRDLIGQNPPLREESERTETEKRVGAMLPGDGDPTGHLLEELDPSAGTIDFMMATAKTAHRMAEENPERGAGGPATPDRGGEVRPYEGGKHATEGEMAPRRRQSDRAGRAGPRTTSKGPSARGFPIVKGD